METDPTSGRRSLIATADPIHEVDHLTAPTKPAGAVLATDDEQLIREWARVRGAEPATGEQTESGPATVDVHDGGVGIRFNFPGAAAFRPISWDEWLANLRAHALLFVYERDSADGAPSPRYRIVPRAWLPDLLTGTSR